MNKTRRRRMGKKRVRGRFKIRPIEETVRRLIVEADKILIGETTIRTLLEQHRLNKENKKRSESSDDENRP